MVLDILSAGFCRGKATSLSPRPISAAPAAQTGVEKTVLNGFLFTPDRPAKKRMLVEHRAAFEVHGPEEDSRIASASRIGGYERPDAPSA